MKNIPRRPIVVSIRGPVETTPRPRLPSFFQRRNANVDRARATGPKCAKPWSMAER